MKRFKLPGAFKNNPSIKQEYLEEQSYAIWNTFTSIPLNNREEILKHIQDRLKEVAHKYYNKGLYDTRYFTRKNKETNRREEEAE